MTYPSQPGYPTPQYGGPPQQPQQQNNLWLIGGAVLTVLIIVMTVILLVVQSTHDDSNSGDGGNDPTGGANETSDGGSDGGTDNGGDGGDNGGDDGGSGTVELNSEACTAFDFGAFEDAYGPVDPDETSSTESSTNGLGSLDCTFYNADITGVNLSIDDFETAEDAKYWVESDADYYNADNGYEFSEYTKQGDAGAFYTQQGEGWKSIYLHVAFGSLEVKAYTTLWGSENIDEAAATAALEDFVSQSGTMFADLT